LEFQADAIVEPRAEQCGNDAKMHESQTGQAGRWFVWESAVGGVRGTTPLGLEVLRRKGKADRPLCGAGAAVATMPELRRSYEAA